MGDYCCVRSHIPPSVYSTISPSIGPWERSASPRFSKRETARSCAIASPATCPATSAAHWTYHTVSGENGARFGAKLTVPNRSHPRPNGSEMSEMMNYPWMTNWVK